MLSAARFSTRSIAIAGMALASLAGCASSPKVGMAVQSADGDGFNQVSLTPADQSALDKACRDENGAMTPTQLCERLAVAIAESLRSLKDHPLASVERHAAEGSKHAQLELGKRYEEGRGVERDIERAMKLYRGAATDTREHYTVYSAGVGGAPGSVISIPKGPTVKGLPEAAARLEALKAMSGD